MPPNLCPNLKGVRPLICLAQSYILGGEEEERLCSGGTNEKMGGQFYVEMDFSYPL